ncbi:NADH-quinone oxidoreductase subunit M [Ornithinimicrobium pekingense]|uniref:NADH-quinone oxidoreductase subunit M n=1 Tax=Ornithinimicrobium pekingense TaxID=384677 RepID=A0ABQ2FG52_9MICO|nr:NADH-quinone oxidoreductase subunit M [Ornithinimicrobium pekingense]GGK82532.1 NADH-quinone oxidoreductase subunit M [Ornithinimicrobium pekingense]
MNFPWLTTLLVLPLVGALVVALLPRASTAVRPVALGFSLATLAVGLGALTQYRTGSSEQFQLTEVHSWIPQFGVSYALGVDGISLTMILLGLVLVPVCILAAWNDVPVDGRRQHVYFSLMLTLLAAMVGVFAAIDVFLFYVFFEAMLIPVYFLIGMFGGARRWKAATTFLLYSLVGGLIMLVAVIGVYLAGPRGTDGFLVTNLTGLDLSVSAGRWLFLGFFIAFAIKAPMWPVHTWLPLAAEQARPTTSVLLIGVLDKVGTYGMIRFCLALFPEASQWATPVILALALISMVVGALLAIGQNDMLRLISYTSVSHFGFIVMGIFAFTTVGGSGATLYMINHGFTTAGLFLVAGMLIARHGSRDIRDYGGWQRVTPLIAGVLLFSAMSGLALPGLNSFVSEFMVVVGVYQRYTWLGVLAATGVVLAALYMLLMYQRIATGPRPVMADVPDMTGREKLVVAPILAAFLLLGFFPKPVLDVLEPAVQQSLQHVGATDPAPAVDTATAEGSGR